jgi:hypothetical protein
MSDLLYLAANTVSVWRDAAVFLLAGLVIVLLYLAASAE